MLKACESAKGVSEWPEWTMGPFSPLACLPERSVLCLRTLHRLVSAWGTRPMRLRRSCQPASLRAARLPTASNDLCKAEAGCMLCNPNLTTTTTHPLPNC